MQAMTRYVLEDMDVGGGLVCDAHVASLKISFKNCVREVFAIHTLLAVVWNTRGGSVHRVPVSGG